MPILQQNKPLNLSNHNLYVKKLFKVLGSDYDFNKRKEIKVSINLKKVFYQEKLIIYKNVILFSEKCMK